MQLIALTVRPSTASVTIAQVSFTGPVPGQSGVATHARKQVPFEPQKPDRHWLPCVHAAAGLPVPTGTSQSQVTSVAVPVAPVMNGWQLGVSLPAPVMHCVSVGCPANKQLFPTVPMPIDGVPQ